MRLSFSSINFYSGSGWVCGCTKRVNSGGGGYDASIIVRMIVILTDIKTHSQNECMTDFIDVLFLFYGYEISTSIMVTII